LQTTGKDPSRHGTLDVYFAKTVGEIRERYISGTGIGL
jgi:hypothetical protein